MTEPDSYSYPRYLQAKRSVDARALNRRVWTHFLDALSHSSSPLQILEVGGGIGATFQRLVDALVDEDIGEQTLYYTLVDREPKNVQAAYEHLPAWAADQGYEAQFTQDEIHLVAGPLDIHLSLVTADLYAFADRQSMATFDAIIAQAVLDLLKLSHFFASLRPLLKGGGLWYLPIHFDGVTGFEPSVDRQLDDKIERLYHESMEGTDEKGEHRAHTGRRLLTVLQEQNDQVLAAGSSDWIVFPRDGEYQAEEAYFLYHILNFIDDELSGHSRLDQPMFSDWIQTRRQQICDGHLVYLTHQLDVLAQKN